MNVIRDVNCGKKPNKVYPEWKLTTGEIKSFLQKEFNKLTQALRNERGWEIDDIKISLSMIKLSKNYVMFNLILPKTILHGSKNLDNTPSVFHPNQTEDNLPIERPIFEFLKCIMYDKDERQAFRTQQCRKFYDLNQNHLRLLTSFLLPKRRRINGGKDKDYIVVCIDPVKVFYSMLDDDSGSKFYVKITDYKELDKGNFLFTVMREEKTEKLEGDVGTEFNKSLRNAIGPANFYNSEGNRNRNHNRR